jgi:hypothetical protein
VCRRFARSGATDGLGQTTHPLGQVTDLHRARVGDVDAGDLRRARARGQPGALALGARLNTTARSTNAPMCGCIASTVLRQERLLDLRDQAEKGEVDALDLDLGRLLIEQVVQLASW